MAAQTTRSPLTAAETLGLVGADAGPDFSPTHRLVCRGRGRGSGSWLHRSRQNRRGRNGSDQQTEGIGQQHQLPNIVGGACSGGRRTSLRPTSPGVRAAPIKTRKWPSACPGGMGARAASSAGWAPRGHRHGWAGQPGARQPTRRAAAATRSFADPRIPWAGQSRRQLLWLVTKM